jgi:hypothetical protein
MGTMKREVWIRRCSSFEEERVADREFWQQFTPSERVMILEEMRLGKADGSERRRDAEGLRRSLRVLDAPWR